MYVHAREYKVMVLDFAWGGARVCRQLFYDGVDLIGVLGVMPFEVRVDLSVRGDIRYLECFRARFN